jgi:hypothetical protein
VTQRGAVRVEAGIWIASYLLAIVAYLRLHTANNARLGRLLLRSPQRFLSSFVRDSISKIGCQFSSASAVDFASGRLAVGQSWADPGIQYQRGLTSLKVTGEQGNNLYLCQI